MTDSLKSESARATATTKKGRAKAAAKPRATASKGEKKATSHLTCSTMVVEAITKLAEKNGSSLQAIKKSIGDTHKLDVEKQSIHLKKALKKLVETGKLNQLSGQGASGRFKLAIKPKPAKKDAVAEKMQKTKRADSPNKAAVAKKPASKKVAASSEKKQAKTTTAKKPAVKPKPAKKPPASKAKPIAAENKPKTTTAATSATSKPVKTGKAKAAPKIRLPKPKAN